MGGCRPCESISSVDIFECDDIPPHAMDKTFNGIQSYYMAWVSSSQVLRLSQYLSPLEHLDLSEMGYFLRSYAQAAQVLYQSLNGCRTWATEVAWYAELKQERIKLL